VTTTYQHSDLYVISADALVAGTHFLQQAEPGDVAVKSLAVNLSDLAAMGATPCSVNLVISHPQTRGTWQREFLHRFKTECRHYRLELSSVDLVTGPVQISVQAVGRVPACHALRRDQAVAGDNIYVSGTLGDAGLGLQIALGKFATANSEIRDYCLARLNRPSPRLELSLALRGLSRCAIDISDGLCGDLQHICKRSRVGMHVEVAKLPLSKAVCNACSQVQARDLALSAGDDYELCFTAAPARHQEIIGLADQLQLPLTLIGNVDTGPGLRICDEQGQALNCQPSYQHFLSPRSATTHV